MLVREDGVELDDVWVWKEGLDFNLLDELIHHVVLSDLRLYDLFQCADKSWSNMSILAIIMYLAR